MENNSDGDYSMPLNISENIIAITPERITVNDAVERVTMPNCGAIAVFVGTTRNHHDGRGVVRLEYEAYAPMAKRQLLGICEDARAQWPSLEKIAILHRLGLVPVAEASVIIAVSSPHRREPQSAVSFIIDELKCKVAIWKKEVYDDGHTSWKENMECPWKT